jgi:hypothetical protein
MENFDSVVKSELTKIEVLEKRIIEDVWENKENLIKWPKEAILLWDGCIREKYHLYPDALKKRIKSKGITIDSRSNGPAIVSYLFAGGTRPVRKSNPSQQWHVHHIYDGKFSWSHSGKVLRAVEEGRHFTQSAGLVAIHILADALVDEYAPFAWLLRRESCIKFKYDPERVFCKKMDRFGFETP